MKRLRNTGPSSTAPIVDGIHGAICHNVFVTLSLFPYQKVTRLLLVVLTIAQLLYLQTLVKFLSDSSFLSMRIVSRVPLCNLDLNQAPLPLCVPVQSKMLFPDTFIMGRLSSVASLMLRKHLILLIMTFSLTFFWIKVYLWLYLGSCGFGIVDSNCVLRWNSSLSLPFSVSNGVRQGSILSPLLNSV